MLKALIAFGFLLTTATLAFAQSDEDAKLLDFFAGQGCAIGPATRDAAIAAGFTAENIDAFAGAAKADGKATGEGDWLVLPSETCKIRPPEIKPALKLSDPEVVAAISAIDAYPDEPGCFLDHYVLRSSLGKTRGWDADEQIRGYMQLVAASIISGDMTWYSNTPFATPMGFALVNGDCAGVPQINDIKRSHDFLIENFDAIIREMGSQTICENDAAPSYSAHLSDTKWFADGDTPNAWFWFEAMIISFGAGWQEGMTATEKGIPRPPVCHYE